MGIGIFHIITEILAAVSPDRIALVINLRFDTPIEFVQPTLNVRYKELYREWRILHISTLIIHLLLVAPAYN
ncbi:hypothetical protein KNP414_01813 [Paenibacillus mucilaginosus KNP414]|uniref:Uncharacterized protein n=1 Tax=Paenibacillus mucilaginosus (strain KNP414) TaxID=1036673 RepID=F8FQM0_PAEMK|nr:hypothetical protein KNP414_01813 [Paenibacillus mucilaginosus KNP414]